MSTHPQDASRTSPEIESTFVPTTGIDGAPLQIEDNGLGHGETPIVVDRETSDEDITLREDFQPQSDRPKTVGLYPTAWYRKKILTETRCECDRNSDATSGWLKL